MRKIFTYLCAVFMCVVSAIGLAACGKVTVTGAEVISGIETTIVKNTELDTSNVVVKIKYSDNTTENITSADLEFGAIDTTTTGNKDLTIKHKKSGYEFTLVIRVVEDEADVNTILSMQSDLWVEHTNYKKVQTSKENEFYDREQPLYVGDDNRFNFRLNATGLNSLGERVENLRAVRTNVTVKLVEGNTKITLTGDTLAGYVDVNTINAELDFTEEAIGKTFEVTVVAANVEEGYDETQTSFTATLNVIDGFNVYDAQDLSVYDNKYYNLEQSEINENYRTHAGYQAMHEAVATKYGITLNDIKAIKAVILQNNITLHDSDVLEEFFWQYEPAGWAGKTNIPIRGSLIQRDNEGIYYRFVEPDQEFNFIGNYFGVDASRISKMVIETDNPAATNVPYVCTTPGEESSIKVMCSTLFYTTGIDYDRTGRPEQEGAKINWKNLNFFGNGNLNADPRNSGAILLSKFTKADVKAYNNISRSFLISYLVREYHDTYTIGSETFKTEDNKCTFWIDHCKGYENYQCHMYIAGTNDGVTISDCEFKRANGPAIMVDFIVVNDNPAQGVPAKVDIINSTIESLVTGEEPWLRTYGADAMVATIKANNVFFTGENNMDLPDTGKTFVTFNNQGVEQMNAAVFVKGDTANPLDANRLGGYVRFYGENADPTDATKSQAAWAKYRAQEENYLNLQKAQLVTLALLSQYTNDTKAEVLQACQQAIGQYAAAHGIEDPMAVDSMTQMAIAQATSLAKFVEYLQGKIGAALVAGSIDPDDPEQMASEEATSIMLNKVYTEAMLENGGLTALNTFINELTQGTLGETELQMMSLISYISTIQGIVTNGLDALYFTPHDMPVFGLDFDSTFNWAGSDGLADRAFGGQPIMQSMSTGGYLSGTGILTCMPYGDIWAGGANYFDGEYLNLYNNNGIGVIIQLYPTTND